MARVTLKIRKGKTFRKTLYWNGQDVNGALTGIDLTGATARAHIISAIGATPALELTSENGGIALSNLASPLAVRKRDGTIVTLPTGTAKIALYISAVQSAALTIESGVWEPEIVFVDGDVKSPIEVSPVTVSPEATV